MKSFLRSRGKNGTWRKRGSLRKRRTHTSALPTGQPLYLCKGLTHVLNSNDDLGSKSGSAEAWWVNKRKRFRACSPLRAPLNIFYSHWPRGIVVIASSHRTLGPGFESHPEFKVFSTWCIAVLLSKLNTYALPLCVLKKINAQNYHEKKLCWVILT
jgi:hypothetical protein